MKFNLIFKAKGLTFECTYTTMIQLDSVLQDLKSRYQNKNEYMYSITRNQAA